MALKSQDVEVIGIDIKELDFSIPNRVADEIASYQADWVINCAAYTQVDQAEEQAELTYLINRDSAAAVAEGVKSTGGRLAHISTDFIYDGRQNRPYSEQDHANPLSVYGRSKWEAEQKILRCLPDALIVRTAWVFGIYGPNFVQTILRLAKDRDELSVVDDQLGTPTWTKDIANCLWSLIKQDATGLFNFTNEGVASWYDFADAIITQARTIGMPIKTQLIRPISTKDFPTLAKRPSYSVLSKEKIRSALEYRIPHWRESLENMINELQASIDASN